ncbi:isochorismate synthase [Convivina praedatoris]|uniref:isochorismate synthase n=1 Tax=Convivina praedatoris TaxID=2880963 RepID=A0ABN8H907_9LACO|nr:isochorismate synthase [Convivina sp. LMG 32447]CAH1852046.1 Isochorismate synthase MenF [Convivina sp. LMG 32447]CAH1854137.1 Isochorismate synthase MenF [Convivina sp. LMG 32447]
MKSFTTNAQFDTINQLVQHLDQDESSFFFASPNNQVRIFAFGCQKSWSNWQDIDSSKYSLIVGGQDFDTARSITPHQMSSYWFAPKISVTWKKNQLKVEIIDSIDWSSWLKSVHTNTEIDNQILSVNDEFDWLERVTQLIDTLKNDQELKKVVFGRQRLITLSEPMTITKLWSQLIEQAQSYRIVLKQKHHYFVSLTPERLLSVENSQVQTAALAGTAARKDDYQDESKIANTLLKSNKDRQEHDYVTQNIVNKLAPFVKKFRYSTTPGILFTPQLLHLYTPIQATILPGVNFLTLARALHPTPALAGLPQQSALAYLRVHEQEPRGLFGGALGYFTNENQGELAVGIRSMVISGRQIQLFAGAGILSQSQTQSEWQETQAKFSTMESIIQEVISK